MSGMFQRIARRHEDRSDEPVASETSADAAEPGEQPATADEQPAAEAAAPPEPAPAPSDDAPTERIEAVAPASVPPPKIDLRSRIATPAGSPPPTAPAQPSAPPTAATAVTVPAPVAAQAPAPSDGASAAEAAARRPGFRARGRMRRRLRYLRKLRELQARDLGGLVFDLRRFERKREDLVLQKIDQIRACDDELRALEQALDERRDLRDVREPGIGGTCPRCFAIHGSADRFCASCGAALGGAVQGPAQVAPAPPPATDGGPAQ